MANPDKARPMLAPAIILPWRPALVSQKMQRTGSSASFLRVVVTRSRGPKEADILIAELEETAGEAVGLFRRHRR